MEGYIIDITISILFFLIGFLVILLLRKIIVIKKDEDKPSLESHDNSNNEKILEFEIIDALLSKYDEKIGNLEQKIVEQKVNIDGLELFLKTHFPNQVRVIAKDFSEKSQEPNTNITVDSDITDLKITKSDMEERHYEDIGSSTIINVLRMLKDESRSSIEIKQAIGRTREHTARLMKKLTEMNLVERQSNFKPFRYKISSIGEEYLEKESQS